MDTAKIFKNGRSQAVRMPKEYRFNNKEVWVNRVGNIVFLIPKDDPWGGLLAAAGTFGKDFIPERSQGKYEKRERI